jgi:broad specificity phosphatase PhoE
MPIEGEKVVNDAHFGESSFILYPNLIIKAIRMSREKTLFLVRHGENLANITKEMSCRKVDYSLTEKGRLQAEQTGIYFEDKEIHAIYASPLKRAVETAEIIASRLGLSVIVMENFRELNVGDLEDMGNSPEAWQIHLQVIRDWMNGKPERRFPGGEDYFDARQRLRDGVDGVLNHENGRNSIVVGHGGLFSVGLSDLCPEADRSILRSKEFHNCSVSEMVMRQVDDRWVGTLVRWADAMHLSGEAAELVSGLP